MLSFWERFVFPAWVRLKILCPNIPPERPSRRVCDGVVLGEICPSCVSAARNSLPQHTPRAPQQEGM